MHSLSFQFAADSAKEILTFATAVLIATITFAKDTFLANRTTVPVALKLSWILYLFSILCAIWTLLALTGDLAKGHPQDIYNPPSINNFNIVVPSSLMCISFFCGLCATAIAGWQAVRNIVGSEKSIIEHEKTKVDKEDVS